MNIEGSEALIRRDRLPTRGRAGPAEARYKAGDIAEQDEADQMGMQLLRLANEVEELRDMLAATRTRLVELEKLVETDVLTPVANRRGFERHLARAVGLCDRHDMPAALLFVDLDGLKAINDDHGHAAGDAAILHVAEMLSQNVRGSDVVGRLGGDEFGVILFHTDGERAETKADQLRAAISRNMIVAEGRAIPVSVSIGVHPIRRGETPENILAGADAAMYACKRREAA